MFCSFFIIALLTHYQDWDPLLDLCKHIANQCRRLFCCFPNTLQSGYQRPRERIGTSGYVFDRQERESLIEQNGCDSDNNEVFQSEMLVSSSDDVDQQNIQRDILLTQKNTDHNLIDNRTRDISESEPM